MKVEGKNLNAVNASKFSSCFVHCSVLLSRKYAHLHKSKFLDEDNDF